MSNCVWQSEHCNGFIAFATSQFRNSKFILLSSRTNGGLWNTLIYLPQQAFLVSAQTCLGYRCLLARRDVDRISSCWAYLTKAICRASLHHILRLEGSKHTGSLPLHYDEQARCVQLQPSVSYLLASDFDSCQKQGVTRRRGSILHLLFQVLHNCDVGNHSPGTHQDLSVTCVRHVSPSSLELAAILRNIAVLLP